MPASALRTMFPSPSSTLIQSVDDSWQQAMKASTSTNDRSESASTFSVFKLQHNITASLEATRWMRLFHSCGRYQQAILTSLSLNSSTSTWLTTPPLSGQPGYVMKCDEFLLAVRHRLGILPFDSLRNELCINCASRNNDTPELLVDPDHVHSCVIQRGRGVKRRHDRVKMVLAGLARECGYLVEVEPRFPKRLHTTQSQSYCQFTASDAIAGDIHGDLLLMRHSTHELIDVTIVRPTTLTLLQHGGTSTGSHMEPLVASHQAEQRKHQMYDAECARHGWKLIPFVMESYGALGQQSSHLLARMSSHHPTLSPHEFMIHAHRLLSVALQCGNADLTARGTAEMHHHAYRTGTGASGVAAASCG